MRDVHTCSSPGTPGFFYCSKFCINYFFFNYPTRNTLLFLSQFVDLGSGLGSEISSQCEWIAVRNQSVFFLEFIYCVSCRYRIDTIYCSAVQSLRLQKCLKNFNFRVLLSFGIGSIEFKDILLYSRLYSRLNC